jgi:hypothetical protein
MIRKMESDIEQACVDLAEQHLGAVSFKLDKIPGRGQTDRLFLLPDAKVLIIEFKRPGEKVTRQQRARHKHIGFLGFAVHRVDSVDQFREILWDTLKVQRPEG